MLRNNYDDTAFFDKYSRMDRSRKGLEAAGEWHALRAMLPDFHGKRVLDLGCGFGWHCRYAQQQGAASVTGVDISKNMLAEAQAKTDAASIRYLHMPIEEIDFPENSFDVVLSSLAFHYIAAFDDVCRKVGQCLVRQGDFVFSVEHPVFTAAGKQDWHYDAQGNPLHWPVDDYFSEGLRRTTFLGEDVLKYHRTLTSYTACLIQAGFELQDLREPQPDPRLLDTIPGMRDELRRPMMLLVAAKKQ